MIPDRPLHASTFAGNPRQPIHWVPMRSLPLLLIAALGCSCTWFKNNNPVLITSTPPGARIWIDGTDTGRTTPASFDLAGNFGRDHDVKVVKKGFRPVERRLYQHTQGYTSRWIDGASTFGLPPLPIFWTPGDLVFPFGVQGQVVPDELHVKLYREDEPLLGFEVLAARAAGDQAKAVAPEPTAPR